MQYTTEYGEDLERAWLLYADSFVAVKFSIKAYLLLLFFNYWLFCSDFKIQKYDSAEEILKKCLKYN